MQRYGVVYMRRVRMSMCVCLHLSFSKDWGECRTCRMVAYWPPCVFQSRWRWRRLLPRDSGLSAPFALPLCYPGSIPACCLWQWGRCLALPCQPDVVRYWWFLCCLHIPRVLPTLSGKCPLNALFWTSLHFWLAELHSICCIYCLVYWWTILARFFVSFFNSTSLFNAEHSEEIWLHYTCICPLSRGKAPANG